MIILGRGPPAPMPRITQSKVGQNRVKGSRSPNAKLHTPDIRWIRKHFKLSDRKFGGRALGRKYHVSDTVIRGIAQRKMWKHIK